ncbi:flagellar motor protein MotB [Cognatishimia sp. MH4019]|uniref:flagellar motor protein MotB n=1 Tax=Cognatishimia sp. MH4019 TaxID=2854030 RepID=UPI00351D7364
MGEKCGGVMGVQSNAPVIIKRKKIVQGGGHHGGAWKVAYADFVTAMMAFFLLMWLLNATTEKQRKGVADYFSPTIPINRISGGGDGAFGGDSIFSEETMAQNGTGASKQLPTSSNKSKGATGVQDNADAKGQNEGADTEATALSSLEEMLAANSGESMVDQDLLRHIVTKRTDEGLVIALRSQTNQPLFKNRSEPTDLMVALGEMLVRVLSTISNDIAIAGHMRAQPVVLKQNTTWDVSIDRAAQMRDLMTNAGFEPERIRTVRGHASRIPSVADQMNVVNDRIEVIVLREK